MRMATSLKNVALNNVAQIISSANGGTLKSPITILELQPCSDSCALKSNTKRRTVSRRAAPRASLRQSCRCTAKMFILQYSESIVKPTYRDCPNTPRLFIPFRKRKRTLVGPLTGSHGLYGKLSSSRRASKLTPLCSAKAATSMLCSIRSSFIKAVLSFPWRFQNRRFVASHRQSIKEKAFALRYIYYCMKLKYLQGTNKVGCSCGREILGRK